MFPVSALLRDLVVTYITNKETEHGRSRKKK
jgi:hypothetical protein